MKKWQRIEDLRKDLDLTQEQMAKNLYTSETQYRRYENAKGNNFFEAMIQIAEFHNVSLDYIAGRTNDKGGLHKNSTAEQELLNGFNKLSELSKGRILGMIQVLLEQQGEQAEHKADGTQIKNSISINQNNGKVKINNK